MTQLLEEAIDQLYQLPEPQQDAMASLILQELEDEQLWNAQFAASQEQLTRLAAKVRSDIQAGRVREMGWDELG